MSAGPVHSQTKVVSPDVAAGSSGLFRMGATSAAGVEDGLWTSVADGLTTALALGISVKVGVIVGVAVGVAEGVSVGVEVGLLVGVSDGAIVCDGALMGSGVSIGGIATGADASVGIGTPATASAG